MATPADVPGIVDPLLNDILHGKCNWFTVEFAPIAKSKKKYEVKPHEKGTGGLKELKANLVAEDRIFYGLLQVNLVDDKEHKYDKYVYLKYLPNKANKAKRYLWGFENAIKSAFKFKHVLMEYLDENLMDFDEAGITKEFLRVSENQMEYSHIDFGGGDIHYLNKDSGAVNVGKEDEKADEPEPAQDEPEPEPAQEEPEPEPEPEQDEPEPEPEQEEESEPQNEDNNENIDNNDDNNEENQEEDD